MYCDDAKKVYKNPKSLLFYLKNVNLSFKVLSKDFLKILLNLIEKELNIKEYLLAIRPSFNIALDKSDMLFDIIFLSLSPPFFQITEKDAVSLYVFAEKVLDNFSKSYSKTIRFDFECYEVDYYLYEMFDITTCMFYRIPIEIYLNNEINLSYYSFLFSCFVSRANYFDTLQKKFSMKNFIERLYKKVL